MQISEILSQSKDIHQWIVEKRRTIHRHPELMYEEFETSRLVQSTLKELDIPYEKDIAITGVVGLIGNGGDPCIALRADMDALPIHEEADGASLFFDTNPLGSCTRIQWRSDGLLPSGFWGLVRSRPTTLFASGRACPSCNSIPSASWHLQRPFLEH